MLRTNLSTRPFYNERVVHLALAAAAVLVALFTVFNVVRLTGLTRQDRELAGRTQATEELAAKLRQDAVHARAGVDRRQLDAVVAATREANGLIDGRTFSWTGLLNRIERALPEGVRLESIAPVAGDEGLLSVRMVALARRAEEIDTFAARLEKDGGFRQIVLQTETTTPEGLLEVSLQGQYLLAAR